MPRASVIIPSAHDAVKDDAMSTSLSEMTVHLV
jgi:hypothetical protein